MTVPLDDNAVFLWTIIVLGVILPLGLGAYAVLRARTARARLERLRED